MNNFDTSTWKEFLVKNLFRFENPKGKLTAKDLIEIFKPPHSRDFSRELGGFSLDL